MISKILWLFFLFYAIKATAFELILNANDHLVYDTNRSDSRISFYEKNKLPSFSTISKKYSPVSVKSIKNKITLLKGNPKSMRMVTKNKQTIFGFEAENNQMHFFSTKGGHLLITQDRANKTSLNDWIQKVSIAK